MTTAQKIIKYLALAFAAFLTITIISVILNGLYGLTGLVGVKKSKEEATIPNEEMKIENFKSVDITTLNIEVKYTSLTIKTGDYLKAETNNSNIKYNQNNKKLEITEKDNNWFLKNYNEELVVYLPKDLELDKVSIEAGAGKINIEELTTKNITFKLGAGEVEINNLKVENKAKIEGGAGKLKILGGSINNLDLDMGIGKTIISSGLTGNIEINAGVGNLEININGQKDEYKIKASKGLGSIKIDEKEMLDDETFGNGDNYIKVDGGVGNINIKFE